MTAYEMRISDWSSDVCASDLDGCGLQQARHQVLEALLLAQHHLVDALAVGGGELLVALLQGVQEPLDGGEGRSQLVAHLGDPAVLVEHGRATCRESVC